MSDNFAGIDYVILVVYLAATLSLGLWMGRKVHTGTDFFLAGRRLPWWAIGMSLVATDIGGTDIIGLGGAAYSHGMAVANFEWIGCVPAMIVGAFVFIPFLYRTGVYTVPEYMERRFNPAMRSALAFCWLAFMVCNLGIMLLASAKMMGVLFGWNVVASVLVTAIFVGLYTCVGGLAAVVYTDAIQCAVMIVGCLLVLFIGLWDVGGISGLKEKLAEVEQARLDPDEKDIGVDDNPKSSVAHTDEQDVSSALSESDETRTGSVDRTSLVMPVDTTTPFPWTGILFGLALVLSPAYWLGNQAIVQRSLGAESEFAAKASYVWGAVLKNLIPFIIVVPGLIALVKFPDLADGDAAFPELVAVLLPVGLRGVFLAAFIAALMSSVDSYLNSAATILTNDVYKRFINPDAGEKQLLWFGRMTTVGLVCWGILFALFLSGMKEGIYAIFQTLLAFFQGPALAVLLSGMLWKRATGLAAIISFIIGVCFSISLFALNHPTVYTMLGTEPLFRIAEPFLYFSVWAFLVTMALIVVISFITKPDSEDKMRYLVFSSRTSGSSEQ